MATHGSSRIGAEKLTYAKFEYLNREIIETFDALFLALEKRKHELLSRLSSMKAVYDRNYEIEEAIKQLRLARENAVSVMSSNRLKESALDPIQTGIDTQIQQQEEMKENVQDVNLMRFRSFSERILKCLEETDLIELIPEYVGRENPILKKCAWGTGDGEIQNGMGIAFDKKTNEIYIVDSSNHRIQVFSTEGSFIRWFGHELLVDGYGITLSDEAVYVSDNVNLLIKFDKSGNFVSKAGSRGNTPGCFGSIKGLCYDDGLLYVCELSSRRIHIFDSNLSFLKQFGSEVLKYPKDIIVHSNLMYILSQDDNEIYCYSKDCKHIITIQMKGLKEPNVSYKFFAIDSKGNFITSTVSSVILVFSPDGVLKHRLGEGHLDAIHGIAVDNNNSIICVNAGVDEDDCIQKY